MRKKDPNEELLAFVNDHSYYAPTSARTRSEVGAFLEKQLAAQKAEGIIDEDADKISLQAACMGRKK